MTTIVSKIVSTDTPGANKAFYRYQVFRPGDAPQHVTSSVAGVVCAVVDRYANGDAKLAEICGVLDLSAGPVTVPINTATVADTQPAFPATTASIELVGLGTATFNATVNGTMRAFIASSNIEAFVRFKGYANGDCRIIPWIEATSINNVLNSQFSYRIVVKIGTTTVYDSVTPLVFYTFGTIRLLSGQAFEGYYKNGDPQVYVREDINYYLSTPLKAKDYLGRGTEDSTFLAASNPADPYYDNGDGGGTPDLTLTPGSNKNMRFDTSAPGFSWGIGNDNQAWAQFFTSGGGRQSFKAAISNDQAIGTHSNHPSDPVTGEAVSLATRPTMYWGSLGNGGFVNPAAWDVQHAPNSAINTYLLTGCHWALRQCQMQAVGDQFRNDYRQDAAGIWDAAHAPITRGVAWCSRDLKDAAAISPTGSALRAEFIRQMHNNVDFNHARYVLNVDGLANNLGYFGGFYDSPRVDASWMVHFNVVVQIQILRSGLLDGARTTKQIAVCRFACKHPIGLGGLGVTDWPYPHGGIYHITYRDAGLAFYSTFRQAYDGSQANEPFAVDLATYPTITGPVAAGTPIAYPFGTGTSSYGAQWLSALGAAYEFESIYGVTDSASTAAAALSRVIAASNISAIFGANAYEAAKHPLWLQGPTGARWTAGGYALPTGSPPPPPPPPPVSGNPVVSAMTASPGDVDPITGGVQEYAGTSVTYSVTVTAATYPVVSNQFYYSANGAPRVPYGAPTAGAGVKLAVFAYPGGSAGTNYLWSEDSTDSNGGVTSVTLPVNVIAQPVTVTRIFDVMRLVDGSRVFGGVLAPPPPPPPPPPAGTMQFADPSYAVSETGGSVIVRVSRIGGSYGAASCYLATSNGSATAGLDYGAVIQSIDWADGDAAIKSVAIPILTDALVEGFETVNIGLSLPVGATLGSPSSVVLTIGDVAPAPPPPPPSPPGVLQLSALTYSVAEGAGSVVVQVTRTAGSFGAVSCTVTTANGSALAGSDYVAIMQSVNWADGDATPKSVSIPIFQDAMVEGPQTFNLFLSSPIGAALGAIAAAVVTIVDDDQPAPPAGTPPPPPPPPGPTVSVTDVTSNATPVSICSNALLMLGDDPIASFDEVGNGARVMSNLYATARDQLLRQHPWNCATRRVTLSPDAIKPAFGYTYQFTLPGDCIRVLSVETSFGPNRTAAGEDFQIEGRKILINTATIQLRYIFLNLVEATWDQLLIQAMTLTMAERACYAITGSAALQQALTQQLSLVMKLARGVDAQENPPEQFGDSPLLQSRLGGGFGDWWP